MLWYPMKSDEVERVSCDYYKILQVILRPRALFLATRPEARAYKSDVTRRAIH